MTKSNFMLINVTLYFSGSCEHGTFPCGNGDNLECVPQHLICTRTDNCRNDYIPLCGLFYGSNDIIANIVMNTDTNSTNSTSIPLDEYGFIECGKVKSDAIFKIRIIILKRKRVKKNIFFRF